MPIISDDRLKDFTEMLTYVLGLAKLELTRRENVVAGNIRKTANQLGWHVRQRTAFGYPYLELRDKHDFSVSQRFDDFAEVEHFLALQMGDIADALDNRVNRRLN